jgi:magnesium transporter
MHQVDIIEKLGRHFELHPLTLEDILNTGQRPKLEDFESYVFVVLKMLSCNGPTGTVQSEQVSLVIGQNFVISLQERAGDVFEPIRDRIRNSKGRIRRMGADYLAYALMDAVVDNYFVILEKLGERVESLEEELVGSPTENTLQQIHSLKREMIFLRRSVWPLREVISGLERGESSLVGESTGVYLRDVYDHTIQIMDTIESLRDMVSGMLEIYLSSMSNKMNAAMKVLTVIATIFIPLSFFAGVYGMNFEHMPELRWRWVYPYGFWAAIVGVVALMLVLFRRKKWL